ncbi:hypothetical protein [Haloarchaeobius sp. DFWS5]|uniref:hypothetical protein n=1 Tax=Haloarchaeobius sp. DFWS5 TaxID=3446114 RepID=UPI003EBB5600
MPDDDPPSIEQTLSDLLKRATRAIQDGQHAGRADEAKPTVDIVEAGADPTGDEPIDRVLQDVAEPEAVVAFPPGRYLVGSLGELAQDGLELRGTDATLVPDDRTDPEAFVTLAGREQVVDGFEYEVHGCRVAPTWHVRTDARISDVTVTGDASAGPEYAPADSGKRACSLFTVKQVPAGTQALLQDIAMRDGVANDRDARRGWFLEDNDGAVVFDDVAMAGWAENTVYGTYCNGQDPDARAVFRELELRNTNVGLRTTGDCLVEDSVFVHDGPVPAQQWSGGRRQRGVWVEGGKSAHPGGTTVLRNCDFRWTADAPEHAGQPVVVNPPPKRVVLDGLRIDNRHPSWPSVELDPHEGPPVELVVRNLHVTQRNDTPVFRLRGEYELVEASGLHVDADGPLSSERVQPLQDAVVDTAPTTPRVD